MTAAVAARRPDAADVKVHDEGADVPGCRWQCEEGKTLMAFRFQDIWTTTAKGWRIYDPSQMGDRQFDIGRGQVASTLTAGLTYLEGPCIDWLPLHPLLDIGMARSTAEGFLAIQPWWSGHPDRLDVIRAAFPSVRSLCSDSLVVATALSSSELARTVLELHQRLGGGSSGLWVFGTLRGGAQAADRMVQAFTTLDPPTFCVARILQSVGCILCMDDGLDALVFESTSMPQAAKDQLVRLLQASPAEPTK